MIQRMAKTVFGAGEKVTAGNQQDDPQNRDRAQAAFR
jgi:hypothetical protein